jgi:hypothetical protein
MWYIHTIEYCSVTKRSEKFGDIDEPWKELEKKKRHKGHILHDSIQTN